MRVLIFAYLVLLGCTRTYTHRTIVQMPDTFTVRVILDTLKVVIIPVPVVVDSAKIKALEQKRLEEEKEAKRLRAAKETAAWFEKAFGHFVFDYRGDLKTWFEMKYTVPGEPQVFKWVRYEFSPERHFWEPTANWKDGQ